ncbi:MAG: Ig-like domain-containing protein [Ruminiclostridium sp.]|nr:Ig-like domain-containing protein [Ruminiclostridium sp.]
MKKEMLSDEIGKIDSDIIEEAAEKRMAGENSAPVRKRNPALAITAVLVAAAAAITGVVVIPKLNAGTDIPVGTDVPAITTTAPPEEQTAAPTTSTAVPDDSSASEQENGYDRVRPHSDIVSDVSAVTVSGGSIAPDSDLRISLSRDISEEELTERLVLSPKSEFTLTRETDSSYLLSAKSDFARGSLVKLAVTDDGGDVADSWAFRTADRFEVSSCYPSDGAMAAPDTGIEIEFTAPPTPDNAADYFSIKPEVRGKFSVIDNTLCFVPNDLLDINRIYTVTVKAGYTSSDGEKLEEDCRFKFKTTVYASSGDTYLFTAGSNSGFSETFLPGDQPCVEIYCSARLRTAEYETHLYRFGSTDEYKNAVAAKSEGETIDTASLTEVFTSNEKPFMREGSTSAYIMLPEELEPGCYIADIAPASKGDASLALQYLIQVSPISVYALSLGEENILYVNDTETGLPAAGASVVLETETGRYSAAVKENGIAYLKTDGCTGNAVLNIGAKTGRYIDSYILSDAENVKYGDLYYMYLYTDREAYLPNDTVNVWGIVIPKTHDTPLPSDMSISLDGEAQPVTLSDDGTFTAKFSLVKHRESWWNEIILSSGKEEMLTKHVSIREYEKPTYTFDIDSPDYVIMPQVNEVPITLTAAYYEGTPAENLYLYSSSGVSVPDKLRTDSTGTASATVKAADSYSRWEVGEFMISYNLTGVENTYSYASKSIPALYHDRMLKSDYDEDTRTLTLKANELDFTRADEFFATVKNDDGWWYSGGDFDIIKGAPADNIPISVTVQRHRWEKKETGSYYDYIEKKTVKTYDYNYTVETAATYTVYTENGTAVIEDLPTDPELGTYTIELSMKDSFGYEINDYLYVGNNPESVMIYDGTGVPLFYNRDAGSLFFDLRAQSDSTELNGYRTVSTFTENEDITFRLNCSNMQTSFEGKLLLAVYNSDFVDYTVYDLDGGRDIVYSTTVNCIPDVNYTAAYFDGRHIYKVSGDSLFFEPEERGIVLTADTDTAKYDAGETAEITVLAADTNGNMLSGATVMLSVVDEAAFAVQDQDADPLGELYRFISYPYAESYISYVQHFSGGGNMGEKGGGGPASVRRQFKDTAFFASAVTDSDGYAHFSIDLPDNLTTWRATAIAVYEQSEGVLLAGKTLEPVVVTRPVFITPIMHSQFVEGDDIAVSAKCAGLPDGGEIKVTLTGGETDETVYIGQQGSAVFGKLPQGSYTVLFEAEGDGGSDAVEMPLSVTDTLLETNITRSADLGSLSGTVKPAAYPLYAAFFNKEYMFTTDLLCGMMWYSGDSLDSRLASGIAKKELGFMTDEEFLNEFGSEVSGGLAKQLPASQGSVDLTARVCVAAPELVGAGAKTELGYELDSSTLGNVCSAYMGFAALGEPVLNDVKKLLTDNEKIYTHSGLQLAAALALCGDYHSAYDAYIRFVPDITINDSDPDAIKAFVPDSTGKESQSLTRASLIVSSLLGLPEAEYFARYLSTVDVKYADCSLELAIYTQNYVSKSGGEASFSYVRNGVTRTVTIDRHRPTCITFTGSQFEEADFTLLSGEVYVIANYIGRVTENDTQPKMKISKEYKGSMAVGEEITVEITTQPGCVVYDVVPSCGRLTGSQAGQLVRLYTDSFGKAKYKFTVSTAGEYVTESAVAYDYLNGMWGMTDRGTITTGSADESA